MSNRQRDLAFWALLGLVSGSSSLLAPLFPSVLPLPLLLLITGETILLRRVIRSPVVFALGSFVLGMVVTALVLLINVQHIVSGIPSIPGDGSRVLLLGMPFTMPWLGFAAAASAQYMCFTLDGSDRLKYWVLVNAVVTLALSWGVQYTLTALRLNWQDAFIWQTIVGLGFYFPMCLVLGLYRFLTSTDAQTVDAPDR